MKKRILYFLISFLLISVFATSQYSVRNDVALSFDSERIAYNVIGEGKTSLIFIHGWNCDSRYWQNQVAEFAKEFQVVTIDLAGHGHSSQNRINFSMRSFAEDVKAVINKEKIDRAILIGHSMGGGVIAEASRLMQEKVVGIVGIDTWQNVGECTTQSAIEEMVKPFENDFKNATQNFVASMFPKEANRNLTSWVKEDMSSAPKAVSLSAFRNYLEQNVTGEASKVFENMSIPVISINAKLWPTAMEDNKKHIKKYCLKYIEGTGHFPMLEKPEEFNSLLRESINSIDLRN